MLPKKTPRRRGYDEEIAEEICERIADGEKLKTICADARMPARATVFRWQHDHPEFAVMFDCALMARFDDRTDELEEIAKDGSDDWVAEADKPGEIPTVRPNKESLGRSELRIKTLQWIMAKGLPKKYGDQPRAQASVPEAPAAAETPAERPQGSVIDLRTALAEGTLRAPSAVSR